MIYNEDTYYFGFHKNVRELGALPAVTFDTIAGLLRDGDGIGEIADSALCDLLGISKPGLKKIIDKLVCARYMDKVSSVGRGNKTTYMITEKGKLCCPFMNRKSTTLFQEKVNFVSKKGKQSCTINKVLNKEINKESGGDTRTRDPHTFDTTPQNFLSMEDFNLFWSMYPGDPNWSSEKENCERAWSAMPQEWRDELNRQLQAGTRWRVRQNDNPYWYLRNYDGQTVRGELPYLRAGSARFDKWHKDNIDNGRRMCLIQFEDKAAYCLADDLPVMIDAGARVWNSDWK